MATPSEDPASTNEAECIFESLQKSKQTTVLIKYNDTLSFVFLN